MKQVAVSFVERLIYDYEKSYGIKPKNIWVNEALYAMLFSELNIMEKMKHDEYGFSNKDVSVDEVNIIIKPEGSSYATVCFFEGIPVFASMSCRLEEMEK